MLKVKGKRQKVKGKNIGTSELEKAQAQAKEYLAGWQRAKADYLNYRKRTEENRLELMKFCNTDITTAYTFTIYTIPLAGSAADANTDFKAVTLQPGETKIFGRTDVLEVGNFIQGLASTTNKISFSCSLLEKT